MFLLLVLAAQGLDVAHATLVPRRRFATTGDEQPMKALMFSVHVLVQKLSAPSLSELRQAGFTLLGTNVHSGKLDWASWPVVVNWIGYIRQQGFKTFILLGIDPTNPSLVANLVKKCASTGTDIIVLDELIARYDFTEQDFQMILNAGLQVNPSLQFIINEYRSQYVQNAYKWTSAYPSVSIATDDYFDTRTIDLGINLAAQYGKTPLVWLVAVNGTMNFPCYQDLDSWIVYVKDKRVSTFFWWIDDSGTWQAEWDSLLNF